MEVRDLSDKLDRPEFLEAIQKQRSKMIEQLADLESELPEESQDNNTKSKKSNTTSIAETLLEQGESAVTSQQLTDVLRKGTIAMKCVPVLCGSSIKRKGVQTLLDAVIGMLSRVVVLT